MLLQKSYEVGYFGIAYATVQIVDPITSITAGTVLLGEPLPTGVGQVVPRWWPPRSSSGARITLSRLAPDHSPGDRRGQAARHGLTGGSHAKTASICRSAAVVPSFPARPIIAFRAATTTGLRHDVIRAMVSDRFTIGVVRGSRAAE